MHNLMGYHMIEIWNFINVFLVNMNSMVNAQPKGFSYLRNMGFYYVFLVKMNRNNSDAYF